MRTPPRSYPMAHPMPLVPRPSRLRGLWRDDAHDENLLAAGLVLVGLIVALFALLFTLGGAA